MSYTIYTDPPQSRNEAILKATIDGTQYTDPPQSRNEDLLLELKAKIEGGGGGGTTNYNLLENRPQINGNTLEGNMSFANLGIDETPTEDSTNAVASGGVYAGLADKIDKSSTGYETITGNPLEFESPSPQIVGMKCDIEASQDLHGYDKPWAGGEGKNKCPAYTSTQTQYGVTIAGNSKGEISVNGALDGADLYGFMLFYNTLSLEAGTYILNETNPNGALLVLYDSNDNTLADSLVNKSFTLESATTTILRLFVYQNVQYDEVVRPMIRLATETDPTFEPYSNICPISGVDTIDIDVAGGETYTIDLDGTRYGGQLDVTSGVLTLTRGSITYSGSDVDLYSDNYDNLRYARVPKVAGSLDMDVYTTNCVSSMFRCGDIPPGDFDNPEHIGLLCGDTEGNKYWIGLEKNTTLQEAQNLIDGLQVVYELATPQTIQLTPTQVWAVQGGNVITVSVDGVEAEIHSSNYATLKDINDLWNYIKQSPQGSSDGVKFGASNLELIGGTMA